MTMPGNTFFSIGLAAMLLGAASLLAGCDDGLEDPELPPPPALDTQAGPAPQPQTPPRELPDPPTLPELEGDGAGAIQDD